jgi:hypothetical protein
VSDTQARLDAAEREVEAQMGAKLEAQQALMVLVEALDLKLSDLGNGWKEATPKILARIETIVDEAERGFSERDALAAELERVTERYDVVRHAYAVEAQERGRLEGELERVTAALRDALDHIVWMSGSPSFNPDGEAREGWVKVRDDLDRLFALAGGARAAQEHEAFCAIHSGSVSCNCGVALGGARAAQEGDV